MNAGRSTLHGQEVDLGMATISTPSLPVVWAGEYIEEPNIVVVIPAAVDEDGNDITDRVADAIVAALEGL